MVIIINELISVLDEMRDIYIKDPVKAVRSKQFINTFQKYCERELAKLISDTMIETRTEVSLLTLYSSKKVDVVSLLKDNGPVIAVSVKSQMSSAMKNFVHYYEGAVGDVTALHRRFPFLVMGMVWIFPLRPIKTGRSEESVNFAKVERMFKLTTGRKRWNDDISNYEFFSMLVVDFDKKPPQIVSSYPKDSELMFNHFFDKLVETYKERTPGKLDF